MMGPIAQTRPEPGPAEWGLPQACLGPTIGSDRGWPASAVVESNVCPYCRLASPTWPAVSGPRGARSLNPKMAPEQLTGGTVGRPPTSSHSARCWRSPRLAPARSAPARCTPSSTGQSTRSPGSTGFRRRCGTSCGGVWPRTRTSARRQDLCSRSWPPPDAPHTPGRRTTAGFLDRWAGPCCYARPPPSSPHHRRPTCGPRPPPRAARADVGAPARLSRRHPHPGRRPRAAPAAARRTAHGRETLLLRARRPRYEV